jgi:hypothetical protein
MGNQLFHIVHIDVLITLPQRLIEYKGVCGYESHCNKLLLKFKGTELLIMNFLLVISQHSLLKMCVLYVMLFPIHKVQYVSSDKLEIC